MFSQWEDTPAFLVSPRAGKSFLYTVCRKQPRMGRLERGFTTPSLWGEAHIAHLTKAFTSSRDCFLARRTK